MKSNWEKVIPLLLDSEGPETNISSGEPGGASKYGVSVAALSDYRKKQGLSSATIDIVSRLTAADAETFYRETVARACRFDELPIGVDYMMLDVTTNLGNTGGPWLLQIVMGQWPLVPTLPADLLLRVTAMNLAQQRELIYALGAGWLAFKHASPAWPRAGHGWTNRMVRVRRDALAMTGEQ